MECSTDQKEARPAVFGLSWDRSLLHVVGLLTALTVVRLVILASGAVELSGDEAHYWEWSRRLDWCYYSKPPGVAYLIRAGTLLFGDTELGVRFLAPVLSLAASVVLYYLGRRLYDRKTGLVAAVLLQIMPLFSAFGLGLTPDSPLIFLWLLSLLFLHRAWSAGRKADWLLLACSLGLGLLCKYAIIFLYIPAALLLLATRPGRLRLRTPWPYLSFALSFVFFLPVVVWNRRHDWVMFRHDLGHTSLARGWGLSAGDLLNFVGGQLGIVTPILCVLMLYLLLRRRREDPFSFWLSVPILAGFLLKSLQGKVQPNWPLGAWLPGLIVLADFLVHRYQSLAVNHKRLVSAGLIIPAAGVLFLHLPFLTANLPWPAKMNPLRKLIGWRQLGAAVTQLADSMDRPFFLFSDYYMISSELAFYVEGHPFTYCARLGRRMNQYDIWPGFGDRVGQDAIYVAEGNMHPDLVCAFKRVEAHPIAIHDRFGRTVKSFVAYRCEGFKGWSPKSPTRY
jgi:4-amino-4-deoxy-L-arabinose transferase-like glycosyltransferase